MDQSRTGPRLDTDASRFEQFRLILTSSPGLYPVAVDSRADLIQLIHLPREAYARASFLDGRLLAPETPSAWRPWAEVKRAAHGLPARCHFIFHISHVGSTLLSRLLGHHHELFSLREPALLRDLADIHLILDHPSCPWDRTEHIERLTVNLALWSRTFEPGQRSLIKATSFVSEMSQLLMEQVRDARAILMFVPPATFLKALLDGAMSDITGLAGKRLFRLQRRLGVSHWRLQDFSPGECVAMNWLCEMIALCSTAQRFPERVLWANFDRFLIEPAVGIEVALRHLGVGIDQGTVPAILSGPTLGQYAKAPSQKYDSALRDRLLRRGEERHVLEIRKGLDWLDRAAAIPAVRDVLEMTDSTRWPIV